VNSTTSLARNTRSSHSPLRPSLTVLSLGSAAEPGTLVSPGVVEVELKDGSPYNVTCPPAFAAGFDTLMKKGDKEDIGAFDKACTTADFDTNEGCDSCLSAFGKASIEQFFKGAAPKELADVPWSIVPLIDFSNGCPWAQACSSAMVGSIGDKALAAAIKEMIAKCKGAKPGPDYLESFKAVQEIIEVLGVPDAPPAGPAAEPTTPAAESPVASLATAVWPQTVAAIAVVAMMIA